MFMRTALTLAAAILFSAPAYAQKEKKAELHNFPFWSAPKRPHAPAFVPGLQAALQLTPEQTAKMLAAIADTIDSPEIRKLPRKGDPNATADELAKANTKRQEAAEKLHKKVDAILTTDQKGLIEKVNEAYEKVAGEVAEEYAPKLIDAKGNAEDTAALRKQQAEAITATFAKKLDSVLSAEQMTAVKKAAEEEAKRAGNKPNKPNK